MLVYGKNSVLEIFEKNIKVKKAFLVDDFYDQKLKSVLENKKIKIDYLSKREIDELANGNHQGIIVDVGDYVYSDLDDIINENGFIVILDHLEDTHNFGAIIRTCEAAGVDGIIIPKDRSVSVNSTVMKTSSGAAVDVKICMVTNLNSTIKYLKEKGYWIVTSEMKGQDYSSVDYKDNMCLIIGNEGKGVSELVKKNSDFIVSIPMNGKINSLNASVAAGVLIYEVVRQRSA